MFTHRIKEKATNERGALMIEAIALLGLMTMMSPMIVRQTADRTSEMEEVTIAGQMKEIKDALTNWIEAHYQERAKTFSASSLSDTRFTVSAADLAAYLPATYLANNGTAFKGNKLVDGFDIGVRAQCTEALTQGCSPSATNDCTCGTRTAGTVTGLSASCVCARYKMTGIILSKATNSQELDDRRASRIASMIGADGGYMRSSTMINAIASNGAVVDEMKKILGAQGIWEGNVENYFDPTAAGIDLTKGGRIAATTIYSSGFSGDYLYRKKVDGLPGANSMFTDLDMGGVTQCVDGSPGCNRINNAGGLEVVGGRILIRSRNNAGANDQSTGNTLIGTNETSSDYARIALGTDNSHMKVTGNLDFGGTNINMSTDPRTSLRMNGETFNFQTTKSGYTDVSAGYNRFTTTVGTGGHGGGQTSRLDVSTSSVILQANNAQSSLELFDGNADIWSANSANIDAGRDINIDAARDVNLDATINVSIQGSHGYMDFHNSAYLNANNAYISADQTLKLQSWADSSTSGSMTLNANGITGEIGGAGLAKFTLKNTGFAVNMGGATLPWMNFSNNGFRIAMGSSGVLNKELAFTNKGDLELYSNNANQKISFTQQNGGSHSEVAGLVAQTNRNGRLNILGNEKSITAASRTQQLNTPTLALHGTSGRITASYLQPESIQMDDGTYKNPVIYTTSFSVQENGKTTGTVADSNTATFTNIITNTTAESGGPRPYYTHGGDPDYNRFRVDPAFTSVMNDIKITSRGGARLSEALPNYILKGIYELSNSYGSGGWPCSNNNPGNCTFSVPYYSEADLGLTKGGWEHHCNASGLGQHPIFAGGGNCTPSGSPGAGHVTFNYRNGRADTAYFTPTNTDVYYWAHPFLGAVPAPGKTINYGGEVLYAQDEGVCPDGYQAVITVTPTVFELGKVNFVNPDALVTNAKVMFNPGWQNYADSNTRNATSLFQPATKLGIVVEPILDANSYIDGWKIAMGTVTPQSSSVNPDQYIWNAGGIAANSWSAIAHTYCYFNPGRFSMPNMRMSKITSDRLSEVTSGSDVILTPAHNPRYKNDMD